MDDELDARGVAELNDGLENDPAFRREAVLAMVQQQHLYDLAPRLALARPALSWPERLMAAFSDWIRHLRSATRRRRSLQWATTAAAAAVFALWLGHLYWPLASQPG